LILRSSMPVTVESRWSSAARSGPGAGRSSGRSSSASSVRFATRILPLRSRMSPLGACTRISRIRLSFAWFRYLPPERTWTYQSRRKITEKIAIATAVRIEIRRASGEVRRGGGESSRCRYISAQGLGGLGRDRPAAGPPLIDQRRTKNKSDEQKDRNREGGADQALEDRVAHHQEAHVRIDAGPDVDD